MKQQTLERSNEQVERSVRQYFAGARGEPGCIERAFYSSCNLQSVDSQGRLELVPVERFRRFAEAGNLPPHRSDVLDIEVVGNIARATVEFEFESHRFVDFLTLVQLDDDWRIVSKVYTRLDKKAETAVRHG